MQGVEATKQRAQQRNYYENSKTTTRAKTTSTTTQLLQEFQNYPPEPGIDNRGGGDKTNKWQMANGKWQVKKRDEQPTPPTICFDTFVTCIHTVTKTLEVTNANKYAQGQQCVTNKRANAQTPECPETKHHTHVHPSIYPCMHRPLCTKVLVLLE